MFVETKKMQEAAGTREYTYKYLQLLAASICKYLTRESEYSWEKIPASPSMGFGASNTRESESELLGLALVDSLINIVNNMFPQNAFSDRLSQFGFNLFSIFLVDFMHEIELGVWRSLFIHLLRILECGIGLINKLDSRFVL